MEAHQEAPEFFTAENLADRWKVSLRTVRTLVATGELQPLKIGRLHRFSRQAVEAFERCQVTDRRRKKG